MIAADSSSLIAYLQGDGGKDVDLVVAALDRADLCLPPVVITELLSDPKIQGMLAAPLTACATLDILPGFWERAGRTRAILVAKKLKANVPDVLIAQSSIDHDVALITRDPDFRHLAKYGGLRLA